MLFIVSIEEPMVSIGSMMIIILCSQLPIMADWMGLVLGFMSQVAM
jgi:hypothetical protein